MKNILECKNCNKPMRLDDVDFNFKGNQDNYYVCDFCNLCGAVEKIRYGKSIKIEWNIEE